MAHGFCFHRIILAYLIFILAFLCCACGYKANPFVESSADSTMEAESSADSANAPQRRKKALFEEIDTQAAPSYEANEE